MRLGGDCDLGLKKACWPTINIRFSEPYNLRPITPLTLSDLTPKAKEPAYIFKHTVTQLNRGLPTYKPAEPRTITLPAGVQQQQHQSVTLGSDLPRICHIFLANLVAVRVLSLQTIQAQKHVVTLGPTAIPA